MPRAVFATLALFACSFPCLAEDSEMDALQRLFSDIDAIKKRLEANREKLGFDRDKRRYFVKEK